MEGRNGFQLLRVENGSKVPAGECEPVKERTRTSLRWSGYPEVEVEVEAQSCEILEELKRRLFSVDDEIKGGGTESVQRVENAWRVGGGGYGDLWRVIDEMRRWKRMNFKKMPCGKILENVRDESLCLWSCEIRVAGWLVGWGGAV